MAKYRKKPVVVEAKQWFPPGDERHDPSMLTHRKGNSVSPPDYRRGGVRWQLSPLAGVGGDRLNFRAANGDVRVSPGDWIVADPASGDSWPVRADIFAATYEPVEAAGGATP